MTYHDLAVLENVAATIVYPTTELAIASYDPSSVTTVKEKAHNYDAAATIIQHITVLGGVSPAIAVAHIYNVQTGLPALSFNLDATPNLHGLGLNSGSTPRTVVFGPNGLRLPFGIGVRCLSPSARIHVYYRTIR